MAALLLCLAAGCDRDDVDRQFPDFSNLKPVVTQKGTSLGPPRTAQIGPAGGELRSEDGRMTVSIPSGALSSTVTVGIEPISNHCPLGLGNGYRLTPEGVTFNKPVRLTFSYDNAMLKGSAAEFLWITTQKADGTWVGDLRSEPDAAARTVSTMTTHFSDWTMGKMIDLALEPSSSVVKVKNSVDIMITGFLYLKDVDDDLVPLAPINHGSMSDNDLVPLGEVGRIMQRLDKYQQLDFKEWRLDGTKAPVSNSKGKLDGDANGIFATYTAPGSKPNPDNVSVTMTVEARHKDGKAPTTITINTPITITDKEFYAKFNFDGKEFEYFTTYEFVVAEGPKGEGTAGASFAGGQLLIGVGKSDKTNPAMDHGLMVLLKSPVLGTNAVDCGSSSVTFGWLDELKGYQNTNFNLYRMENGVCQQKKSCTSVTVTLNEFKDGPPGTVVSGTMSGTLVYNNLPDCVSRETISFSGEFYLPLQ